MFSCAETEKAKEKISNDVRFSCIKIKKRCHAKIATLK